MERGRQVGLRSMGGTEARIGQQEAGGRLAPGKEGAPKGPAGAETRGMVGSVAGTGGTKGLVTAVEMGWGSPWGKTKLGG